MKAVSTLNPAVVPLARTRFADYLELTKPRIAVLVLFTVTVGALLAPGERLGFLAILNTVIGTALVAAGASALNQYLERASDGLMQRTENRPLPAGRLSPIEVLLFGSLLGVVGVIYLVVALQHAWAALVAAITFVCYVFVYTPLKRRTSLNTLVGAVPGALPPVIGWAAAAGSLELTRTDLASAAVLFLVVFLWQLPHFMAIAWIYRDDYARAGLRMVPVDDPQGGATARHMVGFCLALIAASLLPLGLGIVGPIYGLGALCLGLSFLGSTLAFRRTRSVVEARRVLKTSLVYLPALLALLVLDGLSRPLVYALMK